MAAEPSPKARRTREGPSSPSRLRASRSVSALQLTHTGQSERRQSPLLGGTHAGQDSDRLGCQDRRGVGAEKMAKPRGLSCPAASLARRRLRDKPMEMVRPSVFLHVARETA